MCDGVATFYTDDLEEMERNWKPHANEQQLERYERSKAGEIVTDYYNSTDPELNMVQEDKSAEILFEKEVILKDKLFDLANAYGWLDEVYAAETRIVFRGIRFNGEHFLIGKYRMNGVCRKSFFMKDEFETVIVRGNPVINCNVQKKTTYCDTAEGRTRCIYQKEDFKEDSLETYCWVTVGEFSEEALMNGSIDLEANEIMVNLMRDIPGEAG